MEVAETPLLMTSSLMLTTYREVHPQVAGVGNSAEVEEAQPWTYQEVVGARPELKQSSSSKDACRVVKEAEGVYPASQAPGALFSSALSRLDAKVEAWPRLLAAEG